MLKPAASLRRGFTLIELMITVTIIGIALTLGAPAYWEWLQNTQIRTTTESMLVGIKLARAEAVKQNRAVLFQLMTFGDPPDPQKCALSSTGTSWVVSVDAAAGKCDVTNPLATPLITQVKANAAGMNNVTVAAYTDDTDKTPKDTITFDALGRATPTLTIDVDVLPEFRNGSKIE